MNPVPGKDTSFPSQNTRMEKPEGGAFPFGTVLHHTPRCPLDRYVTGPFNTGETAYPDVLLCSRTSTRAKAIARMPPESRITMNPQIYIYIFFPAKCSLSELSLSCIETESRQTRSNYSPGARVKLFSLSGENDNCVEIRVPPGTKEKRAAT